MARRDAYDSPIATLGDKGRVTIPKEVREELGLKDGDAVMFRVAEGRAELVPMALVPRDQAWFYAPAIQRRVAEAEAEIARGETTSVRTATEAHRHLERLRKARAK